MHVALPAASSVSFVALTHRTPTIPSVSFSLSGLKQTPATPGVCAQATNPPPAPVHLGGSGGSEALHCPPMLTACSGTGTVCPWGLEFSRRKTPLRSSRTTAEICYWRGSPCPAMESRRMCCPQRRPGRSRAWCSSQPPVGGWYTRRTPQRQRLLLTPPRLGLRRQA